MNIIALGKRSHPQSNLPTLIKLRTKDLTRLQNHLGTYAPSPRNLQPSSAIQVQYNPNFVQNSHQFISYYEYLKF